MNIVVDDLRSAKFTNPEHFAEDEITPLVVTGLVSPDTASLRFGLFDSDGNILALCTAFTAGVAQWTGNLDCQTEPIQTFMLGKLPDYRLTVYATLVDKNRVWFSQVGELIKNPLAGSPVAPDPTLTYLTTSLFANIADLPANPTVGETRAKLIEILEALKQT